MKKFQPFIILLVIFFVCFGGRSANAASGLSLERISGKDRFEVAVNVSKNGWKTADTVVLANYVAFADALSASPLAYKENAPILLTRPDHLTESTSIEIKRLGAQNVIIVGGPGSVSKNIEDELTTLGLSVSRFSGKDRYEVANNISNEFPDADKIMITNGEAFADALSIAPFASKNGYPILLTRKNSIPESTMSAIQSKKISGTYAIGGEGSIASTVFNKLPSPYRIGGANRYEVAANVIREFGTTSNKAFIATGATFADALTGSVLAAKRDVPLVLTYSKFIPAETINVMGEKGIDQLTILGGTGSVSNESFTVFHDWEIDRPGGSLLQGYASKTSVNPEENLTFFIKSQKPYELSIYRMGYYNGEGGRLVKKINGLKAQLQTQVSNPLTMDAGWKPSVYFSIPSNWKSGAYMAKIVDTDKKESYIPFVVKSKETTSDLVVLISSNTYQAYNNWGGKSLYGYNSSNKKAAIKVSFNRPYTSGNGAGEFFAFEYNMIRWLEKQNYSISYITDTDVHNGRLNQMDVKALIIPGHDEYWSKPMRDNIEEETKGRMNIGLFSANVGYWQVRMENNNRLMVAYKDRATEDPYQTIDPSQVTTQFRSVPVNRPENTVFGMMYRGIPEKTMPLVISNADHWLYNGTGLKNGDKISGVVGGEIDRYDSEIPNVETIAASPIKLYGKDSVSHVIWYQKPEGGKVFATGTFYWNWFLDPYGHNSLASYNSKIDKITLNAMQELLNK